MKDKIEVGEYVRLDNGKIGKVIEEGSIMLDIVSNRWIGLCCILNHSKNIIDLIEVGDYVNGKEVKHIAMFEGFPDYPKLIFVDETHLIPSETCENEEIKSILTKGQMASIEYKVEEDK